VHRFDRKPVCRSGQQEAAGQLVFIDTLPDGQQKIRRSLHFVYDHAIEPANEGDRIASGNGQHGLTVQR
jgi:hypothetical protein